MSKRGRHEPLSVRVTRDGVLTIEIGIDVNAFAALCSEFAWRCADEKTGRPGETRPDALYKVTSARGFAREVGAALLEEAEDGSSLLTRVLDDASRKAIEDGSQYWMEKDGGP